MATDRMTAAHRRRAAAALAALLAATFAAPPHAFADDGVSGATSQLQATVGFPLQTIRFIGSSGDEIWGYGLPGNTPAIVDGQRVPANPSRAGTSGAPPTVFVVYRKSQGWLLAPEITDAAGQPLASGIIFEAADQEEDANVPASMQASGAAAMLGRVRPATAAKKDATLGLAVRSPGGRFRFIPTPTSTSPDTRIVGDGTDLLTPINAPTSRATEPAADGGSAAPATSPTDPKTPAPTTPEATTPEAPTQATTPALTAIDAQQSTDAATRSAAASQDAATPSATTPQATTPASTTPQATTPAPTTPATTPSQSAAALAPAAASAAARAATPNAKLAAGEKLGKALVLAVDEPTGKGGALIGVTSPGTTDDSVFHWDGDSWSREPIQLPAGIAVGGFRIAAISGTGLGNAWLLGRPSAASGRGLVLFKRASDGTWQEQPLAGSPWADAAPAGTGVTALAPRAASAGAQPLTPTPGGLWIDGSLQHGGTTYPFTVYFDTATNSIRGSWCDAPVASLCLNSFGGRDFGTEYKSFAWGGGGTFGQRVITNSVRARGATTGNGTRLTLDGVQFKRNPGLAAGGSDAAFSDPNEGWLGGVKPFVQVTASPDPARMRQWPVPARKPLLAVAPEPGRPVGAPDTAAVAVGLGGTITRYTPGSGWVTDSLLNGDGLRQTPDLRAVAWPEQNRIHAVGGSEMWMYRGSTGLWEPDPSKPLDFDGNLVSVAFQPGNPGRGYAVGREGLILSYAKTWEPQAIPAEVQGADILSVTFAGSRAYAVWRMPDGTKSGLLYNDGGGWQNDTDAAAVFPTDVAAPPTLVSVAGLPDGGVVAAGNSIVIKRDGPGAAWRLATTPITGNAAISVAPFRERGDLRAAIATYDGAGGGTGYPQPVQGLPIRLPGDPPYLLDNVDLPLSGAVLRETDSGSWSDETHSRLPSIAAKTGGFEKDTQGESDFVYALSLSPDGTQGWAVGGAVVRSNREVGLEADSEKRTLRTAAAFRYPINANDPEPPTGRAPIPLDRPVARLAIGGHAACKTACADAQNSRLAADVGLAKAISAVGEVAGQVGGPRAFIYTGTRLEKDTLDDDDAQRFAQVAGGPSTVPFYATRAQDATGTGATPYQKAFASFPAPFGSGTAPNGITSPGVNPVQTSGLARTYYTFDSDGLYGKVRVIVIDNAAGGLADASGDQQTWLIAALDDAKAQKIPAIVVGNRTLDATAKDQPPATDATAVAQLLVAHGASAYFYDAPGINKATRVPANAPAASSLPAFGTGTLGYGDKTPANLGQGYFSEAGYLLTEIDVAKRDPLSNVAPVNVRLIPIIDQVAIDPEDGTLIRRSKVAKFTALGRLPVMGGVEPYQKYPSEYCQIVFCEGRISPEYSFTSSRPDIANFVQRDARVSDPKAPFRDAQGNTIEDVQSGLVCAYNSGTADLRVNAGGRTFTQRITVQAGAVSQPCGTVRLAVLPVRAQNVGATAPPPAGLAPAGDTPAGNPVTLAPPPPPPAVVPPNPPAVPAKPPAVPPVQSAFVPLPLLAIVAPLAPLPPPSIARPLPPPTPPGVPVTQPVPQVEEKREEEEAYESSQAYAVALPHDHSRVTNGALLVTLLALGAGMGAITRSSRRRIHPGYAEARVHYTPERSSRRR